MCPYANYQIKGFPLPGGGGREDYPLKRYLDAGIRVTVNTDNIGISAANLSENLLLAARLCPGLTRMDLLRIQSHAIQTAFISPAQRGQLTGTFSSRLSQKSAAGFVIRMRDVVTRHHALAGYLANFTHGVPRIKNGLSIARIKSAPSMKLTRNWERKSWT